MLCIVKKKFLSVIYFYSTWKLYDGRILFLQWLEMYWVKVKINVVDAD